MPVDCNACGRADGIEQLAQRVCDESDMRVALVSEPADVVLREPVNVAFQVCGGLVHVEDQEFCPRAQRPNTPLCRTASRHAPHG